MITKGPTPRTLRLRNPNTDRNPNQPTSPTPSHGNDRSCCARPPPHDLLLAASPAETKGSCQSRQPGRAPHGQAEGLAAGRGPPPPRRRRGIGRRVGAARRDQHRGLDAAPAPLHLPRHPPPAAAHRAPVLPGRPQQLHRRRSAGCGQRGRAPGAPGSASQECVLLVLFIRAFLGPGVGFRRIRSRFLLCSWLGEALLPAPVAGDRMW
jgi:hypothetical protein